MADLRAIIDRARSPDAWQAGLGPRRTTLWRATGEAVLGWVLIGAFSGEIWWRSALPGTVHPRGIFTVLAWLWLLIWPLWRLQRVRERSWWRRALRALLRIALLGTMLSLLIWFVQAMGTSAALSWKVARLPAISKGILFYLPPAICVRALVATAPAIRRWLRSKLYRQLVVSHLAAILITLVAFTVGGISMMLALAAATWPDAAAQTQVVTEALATTMAGSTIDAGRVQQTLDALDQGAIRPGYFMRSLVLYVVPWRVLDRRVQVLDPTGQVIAATQSANGRDGPCAALLPRAPLPVPLRAALVRGALAGRVTTAPVPADLSCGTANRDQFLAAAPLYGRNQRAGTAPSAIVIVQGTRSSALLSNVVSLAFVSSGAASVFLIGLTVLPALALSAAASYVFARGQTRRLVAVSRAAEAIAAGDLSQRAPVTVDNEIGRLATDFNRMAASQEQAIAELQQARAQAEQALQARQELFAGVSHELRTPIAIVQAQLESLQLQQDQVSGIIPLAAQTIEALHSEMQRLAGLVDDLFALARVEAGVLRLTCVPTDVTALMCDVATLLRPLAMRESAVTLTATAPADIPAVLVDGDRLRQILANLVRNAIRHTPEGGIIALSAAMEGTWVVLRVADTGEGIAPEHLPYIFERFYRVDPARSRASGGAGLGLAIVREFVEEMGGKVTAESAPGEGTCFHVYLRTAAPSAQEPKVPVASR